MRQELTLMAGMAGLLVVMSAAWAGEASTPTFKEAKTIISHRCMSCHSEEPDHIGVYFAPNNIKYDDADAIRVYVPGILKTAVQDKTMPPANITEMTDTERQTLGAWIAAGAKIP